MTIEADDTLRAIYFLSGREQDWMAGINEAPDGAIKVTYRFRYYDPRDPDNDSWSGKDKKNWYEMQGKPGGPPTLPDALHAMQKMMDMLQAVGYVPKGGIACKLIKGPTMTVQQFFDEFKKLPFVHAKMPGDPGYEKAAAPYKKKGGR